MREYTPLNSGLSSWRFFSVRGLQTKLCLPGLLCALILIFLVPMQTLSQNKPMTGSSIELLRNQVKQVAQNTQTISSNFIQEKEMSMITEKITSKGKFYFKKEKMLRWEYMEPFSYLIIIRNDDISVIDENQVSQFNVKSNKVYLEINRIILGSIQGTLLNDEKNFLPDFFENQSSFIVVLKPLSARLKESLKEIKIHFNRKDYSVDQIEMFEPGGDRTRITFTSKKLNQPIADEKFMVR
ncbi:MAG: outer membrane lipoprotein carrier protein LolA [Bacteroidota bacterium]